ncbi:MAG: helix-turn-helix domain-containing protein [Proteobacteria bacterium]|nr:helix-turn-helix domain-containing protein [Pseudomonadota bacterium]
MNAFSANPYDLDPDVCEAARLSRNPHYDGRFFVCVKTTGIYCRPICRVKLPKRENVLFVPTAAAAERHGYRPCLRCRPETAPGSPAWRGTAAVVSRGIRIIEEGYLDGHAAQALADRLGIGVRHMNRLFEQHAGASPAQIASTLRVQKAKKLITETNRRLGDIAFDAGFRSVRRFNDAIRQTYGRPPSQLRG